ncbi:MAG: insulinase family protein [Spirochaetes bacterium]|nr:insulinase family protein [Spirochaetota bacterium]
MIRIAVQIMFLVVLLSHSVFASEANIDRYLTQKVFETYLSNGIKVLLIDRGYAPTLALIISFKVGSADESYDTIGAAHLLEHMLFKGTEKIGTKDYAKERKLLEEIEAVGETVDYLRLSSPTNEMIPKLEARLKELQEKHRQLVSDERYDKIYSSHGGIGFNAGTSRDMTSYVIELPSSKLELWAEMESERLCKPVFREFYTERDTVYEERLMRIDSDGSSLLYETFIATAFLSHPYRHPIIGWKSNIKSLSINKIRDFYYTHYIPSRMTIAIVGKQEVKKTVSVLESHFGKIPPRPVPKPIAIQEPPKRGERRCVVKFNAQPQILVGWHVPNFTSKDYFALDVLEGLLGDGKTSRLYRSLVLEKKIASRVEAWNGFPGGRFNSLFVISASPRVPHTTEELEHAIYREIENMKEDLQDEEIQRVKNRIESSLVFTLESNMGIARYLSYFDTITGDWRNFANYFTLICNVHKSDILYVLNTYFKDENRTVGILVRVPDK